MYVAEEKNGKKKRRKIRNGFTLHSEANTRAVGNLLCPGKDHHTRTGARIYHDYNIII